VLAARHVFESPVFAAGIKVWPQRSFRRRAKAYFTLVGGGSAPPRYDWRSVTAAKLISEAANVDRFPKRVRQIRWPGTGSGLVRLDPWSPTCMPFRQ
jgi:hypothetical protein